MDIEKEIRRMARDLLKRNPLRRGPFIFDEEELLRIAGLSSSPREGKS
jgi:hypothetical protein